MTLETSTATCWRPTRPKGSLARAKLFSASAAAIGREVIGAEPVLADDDRVGGDAAHLFDEAREVPGDLRVGRAEVRDRGGDRLRLAEPVHLHHPGHDRAAGGLPDQGGGEAGDEEKLAQRHEAPVPRLDAGGADALIPGLGGALVGRLGLGRAAVADGGAPKGRQ